jgi:hypothetical protein
MAIEGLPEGVECVRIGHARPDEFELFGKDILQGGRPDSIAHVIVRPAPGWSFVLNADGLAYVPAKVYDEPKVINVSRQFVVANSREEDALNKAIASMEKWPGYHG